MKVIYHGFDGLEFAINASLTETICDALSKAQAQVKGTDEVCALNVGNDWLHVEATGARGGYAYRCKHPATGDWFFKKHSQSKDTWGIRFSASSHAIAINGLEGLRRKCAELLHEMEISAPDSAYRPSRVDFAVDFILPEFELDPELFVINSQTSRKDIFDIEKLQVNAKSNRSTSITVGKMPNRQVIIYDKSLEARIKGKHEWPMIWRKTMGEELNGARVWRVELRVAKRHLKDVWNIDGWFSFYELLPRIMHKLMEDMRYCVAGNASNRSRWQMHPVWRKVSEVVAESLFDHTPLLSPEEYTEVKREQKIAELHRQALGLLVSTAAIEGVDTNGFDGYLAKTAADFSKTAKKSNPPLDQKIVRAKRRYLHLV